MKSFWKKAFEAPNNNRHGSGHSRPDASPCRRLVHNSYLLNLSGDSLRKRKTKNAALAPPIDIASRLQQQHSRPARHWTGVARIREPACAGTADRHRRNTQATTTRPIRDMSRSPFSDSMRLF